jgi:tRNA (mo5U34)-methyltransferase
MRRENSRGIAMTRLKPETADLEALRKAIVDHGRWWHEIELAPGIITPGDDSNRMKVPILDEIGLPQDLKGMRALDVGCSDGFFSFELERRGADVVAIDFVPETYTGFAIARRALGSTVEYRMDNVYNIRPETYGTFDLILFLGVLYHLRKPLAALDRLRSVLQTGGQLFVGTMMIDEYVLLRDGQVTSLASLNPLLNDISLWQAYPRDSLNGDYTNCFAPNRHALEAALSDSQFRVDAIKIVSMGGYARATATVDELAAKYQHLDGRLQDTPFDPSVPYFLDEEGSVQTVTPRKHGNTPESDSDPKRPAKRRWWRRGR